MSDMGGDLNPRRRSPSSLPPATPPLDLDAGSAPGTRAVRLCLPGAPGAGLFPTLGGGGDVRNSGPVGR